MAIRLQSKPNVTAPGGNYPYGSIKDNPGDNSGTPVNRFVYDDFHQFFARLLDLGNVTGNDQAENSANTFQYHIALQNIINASLLSRASFKGNIDCSGNPNYPAGAIGDFYYVSVAGKIGGASGILVKVGDCIICKVVNAGGDQATVGTSWFILQGLMFHATEGAIGFAKIATQALVDVGTDDLEYVTSLKLASNVIQATEARKGIAEIATQGETNAGTNDITIVTPLKLATPPSWQTVSLVNSWAVIGSSTPQYRKNNLGKVEWRGVLDGSSRSNVKFTNLPLGYRPSSQVFQIIPNGGSGSPNLFTIKTNGDCEIQSDLASFFIDGFSFFLD